MSDTESIRDHIRLHVDLCREDDLKSVFEDEMYVGRFLKSNGNDLSAATQAVLENLRLRKSLFESFQVENLCSEVPTEMFTCCQVSTGWLKNGVSEKFIWYDKAGVYRRIPNLADLTIKFTILTNDNLLTKYGYDFKYDVYFDISRSSVLSFDIDFSMRMMQLMNTCYPDMIDQLYFVGFNSFTRMMINAIIRLVPSRYHSRVHFIDSEQTKLIKTFVEPITPPSNCPSLEELSTRNVAIRNSKDKLVKYFDWVKSVCQKP